MKIKQVKLIKESYSGDVEYVNSTEDQFPYIEAAIDSLDRNLNWWKDNYEILENDLLKAFKSAASSENISDDNVEIESRFIIYYGQDDMAQDVRWTGPAIQYEFKNADSKIIFRMKKDLGNIWNGRKIIANGNKLIVMFE